MKPIPLHQLEIDITGQRFGRLVAMHKVGRKRWQFKCDCGAIVNKWKNAVTSGKTTSCGCLRNGLCKLRALKVGNTIALKSFNLIGRRFGSLAVLNLAAPGSHKSSAGAYWVCRCDCGNLATVRGGLLRNGQTTSCGCKRTAKRRQKPVQAGEVFGKLTTLRMVKVETKVQGFKWECQCACGNRTIARAKDLRYGTTKSCGCAKAAAINRNAKRMGRLVRLIHQQTSMPCQGTV